MLEIKEPLNCKSGQKKSDDDPPRDYEVCTLSKRVISREKVEEGPKVENQLD
jgi:hypothetical protein